jgi:type VI secretion system protein ImpL
MLSFFKRRAFLLLIGFVLIAAFIWYAGPYFAFADYYPLESVNARLIAIALIVALWVVSRLLRRLRASLAGDKLVKAVIKQSHAAEPAPSADVVKLREGFEHAVATLKERKRSHTLYDLPWYVFIGAPGSGKTTALLSSGLNFAVEQGGAKARLKGIGGTRNCDWWFTDEAIFLDTAGRFTTQDSDASSDSAAWKEFLTLLRQYRHRRPINGVILTISAKDLMTLGASGREAQVEAARLRLRELNRELQIQLPVYVMVTMCDMVAGFAEYFDDLAQEGRAQVWGVTFPYEQTLNGESTQRFVPEFDALIARLNERLFSRVDEDRDVRRRTTLFAFPQQMAALRDPLGQFVSDVFEATRFDQQVLLRGVYFTSGTQEGTPIDRLLGSIGRGFGIAAESVAPTGGRGKAYFVERLLKEVLIGESGLAGVNKRVEMRRAALQLGAYAAMALLAVLGIIALTVSYGRNRTYIAEAGADVARLQAVPPMRQGASLQTLLPRLNAVRAVVDSANRYQEQVPWSMRWGLYQGNSIGNSAGDAYVRELDGSLLPFVAARFKQRLVQYGAEPEKLYEYLKAYLMLGQPEHLDKKHLQFLADLEWSTPNGVNAEQGQMLSRHFQGLLDRAGGLRPIPLDSAVVAQARSSIRQASVPRIMYAWLKDTYARDDARAVRLDVAAGVGAAQVLRRKSGVSLAEPVPAIYGRTVFRELTGRDLPGLVRRFSDERWVWGDSGLNTGDTDQLARTVIGIYEEDYISAWNGILNDLELAPFSSVQETADGLAILSGPTSPLRSLLQTVSENTSFVEAPEDPNAPKTVAGTVSSARRAMTDRLGKLFPGQITGGLSTTPGARITAHFQPIHRLLLGAPAPIDAILTRLGQLQEQLRALGPDVGGGDPLQALSSATLRDTFRLLQQEAEALPPNIRPLVTQIGAKSEGSLVRGAATDLEARYQAQVLRPCIDLVAGRYPFSPGSPREVPMTDFGRIFGYGGVFDAFFAANLEQLVDRTGSPWRWRPGVHSLPGILEQFEAASLVRENFFATGSQRPDLRFAITITELDTNATRFLLDIEGQRYEYRRDGRSGGPGVWPGPEPGFVAAIFEDRSGIPGGPRTEGNWAWFRFIENAQPQAESETRTVLTIQTTQGRAHQARVVVEATTLQNPFRKREWRRFSCGS